jgi:hypothetical protein
LAVSTFCSDRFSKAVGYLPGYVSGRSSGQTPAAFLVSPHRKLFLKTALAMYVYNNKVLRDLLGRLLQKNIPVTGWDWLLQKAGLLNGEKGTTVFYTAFTALPRFTGKSVIQVSASEEQEIRQQRSGFSVTGFSSDRVGRIWLILQLPAENKTSYLQTINQLFLSAEMNELVALYSALPVFAYPQDWESRCAEGIRTNIASVLEAIVYENPYPAEYLSEAEWNQMILKAIFTGKEINRIIGLEERANPALSHMLIDYAHERQSAGRTVDPQLWRLAGRFADEKN